MSLSATGLIVIHSAEKLLHSRLRRCARRGVSQRYGCGVQTIHSSRRNSPDVVCVAAFRRCQSRGRRVAAPYLPRGLTPTRIRLSDLILRSSGCRMPAQDDLPHEFACIPHRSVRWCLVEVLRANILESPPKPHD